MILASVPDNYLPMARLDRAFFECDTVQVSRSLLGCMLVHGPTAGRIVETEAYMGWNDEASHAFRRRTPRNAVMFGPAGVSYVYLIYGIHWLFNVVAKPRGVDYGAAVLIRALEPLAGLQYMAARRGGRPRHEWTNGPGRLTQALNLNGSHSGQDLTRPDNTLYLEQGEPVAQEQIMSGPRIGIRVGEPWQSIPWRFWIDGNRYVSGKKRP